MIEQIIEYLVIGFLFSLAVIVFVDLFWYVYRHKKKISISDEEEWRRAFDVLPMLYLFIGVLYVYYGIKHFIFIKEKA